MYSKYFLQKSKRAILRAILSGLMLHASAAFALQEGTTESAAVLKLVNTADQAKLDIDVGLDSRAATNIVAHRIGPDGVENSADDNPFDSIAELDAVSYVGTTALDKLQAYAMAAGYAKTEVVATTESSHPYGNNTTTDYVIRNLNAGNIQLHFERLELLAGDTLTLLDMYGSVVTTYSKTGSLTDMLSPVVSGNAVTLRLQTDANLNNYGFKVDRYSYDAPALSVPTVLYEERFPYYYENYDHEQRIVFQGGDVYMTEWTPINSSVSQADLAHWQFTDGGFVKQSKLNPPLSAWSIGLFNNQAVTGEQDKVYSIATGNTAYLHTSNCCTTNVVQIESDKRGFVYVGTLETPIQAGINRNYVQIFNTRTFSGTWEHTQASAQEIPFPNSTGDSRNRFYVDDHLLIMHARGDFAIYNVENPYAPYHMITIDAGNYVSHPSLRPLLVHGHIIVPYAYPATNPADYHLSSFDITTGYEVGYLPMPEYVMFGGVYALNGNTLYVGGKSKVYVIDVSDPANLQLRDTIIVTYEPTINYIDHLQVLNNKLYVVYKGTDFNTNGLKLRTIGLPANYPN